VIPKIIYLHDEVITASLAVLLKLFPSAFEPCKYHVNRAVPPKDTKRNNREKNRHTLGIDRGILAAHSSYSRQI